MLENLRPQHVYVRVCIYFQRKCDVYWPKEGTDTYGFVEVTLEKEEVMANYTIRTMKIKHLKVTFLKCDVRI